MGRLGHHKGSLAPKKTCSRGSQTKWQTNNTHQKRAEVFTSWVLSGEGHGRGPWALAAGRPPAWRDRGDRRTRERRVKVQNQAAQGGLCRRAPRRPGTPKDLRIPPTHQEAPACCPSPGHFRKRCPGGQVVGLTEHRASASAFFSGSFLQSPHCRGTGRNSRLGLPRPPPGPSCGHNPLCPAACWRLPALRLRARLRGRSRPRAGSPRPPARRPRSGLASPARAARVPPPAPGGSSGPLRCSDSLASSPCSRQMHRTPGASVSPAGKERAEPRAPTPHSPAPTAPAPLPEAAQTPGWPGGFLVPTPRPPPTQAGLSAPGPVVAAG
ncbi:nascent polypeptide-associated complex subunit alpha, muscle-specific form-like [Panthera tigris]|uniref:nascent polypeptide-associated complex subunit alpha, muscle-specific form-like n=1 Tax=Panthera tigris TaxID=9694 RepID=UPI001C6F868E|nr:nascent polypeptide-associated complex subunit alpha, muscle-specific form-like [Panthera tigris]